MVVTIAGEIKAREEGNLSFGVSGIWVSGRVMDELEGRRGGSFLVGRDILQDQASYLSATIYCWHLLKKDNSPAIFHFPWKITRENFDGNTISEKNTESNSEKNEKCRIPEKCNGFPELEFKESREKKILL